jgi:hypothetical protein
VIADAISSPLNSTMLARMLPATDANIAWPMNDGGFATRATTAPTLTGPAYEILGHRLDVPKLFIQMGLKLGLLNVSDR